MMGGYNSLILPKELRIFNKANGIINIKKFAGLMQLEDKYEYTIVLDAESKFIKNGNLEKVCTEYFNNKVLYSNTVIYDKERCALLNNVYKGCRSFFSEKQAKELERYEDNYLWFNQLCIYKNSTLKEFFEITNLRKRIKDLSFTDFDYYIYMYYLILYHNFKIKELDTYAIYGMLDGYDFIPKFNSTMFREFAPYHCNPNIYKKINNKNVFLFIQLNANVDDKGPLEPIKIIKYKKLRKFISFFIPVKRLRRKIRGKR